MGVDQFPFRCWRIQGLWANVRGKGANRPSHFSGLMGISHFGGIRAPWDHTQNGQISSQKPKAKLEEKKWKNKIRWGADIYTSAFPMLWAGQTNQFLSGQVSAGCWLAWPHGSQTRPASVRQLRTCRRDLSEPVVPLQLQALWASRR